MTDFTAYNPQAPHSPPQSPRRVEYNDDDEKVRSDLLDKKRKSEGKLERRGRFVRTLLLLTGLAVSALVAHRGWQRTETIASPIAVADHRVHESKRVQEVGWLDAIEELRLNLTAVSNTMRLDTAKTEMIEISPLYDLIEKALNTVGVRGVFFELFWGLPQYIKKDNHCRLDYGHGVGCGHYDPWWLQHYVGIVTADILVRDGQVLLDGTTGERIYDAVSFMKELHRMQQRRWTDKMSFHAEHGFILHYVAVTMPNVTTYPTDLVNSFCGDYLFNNIRAKTAHKNIGTECYHGFGHAVFAVVAARQLGQKINARKQFRPNGGFLPTDQTICEAYKLCEDAPNSSWIPQKFCVGGFQHTAQLLDARLNSPGIRDKFFAIHQERCGFEMNAETKKFFAAKKNKISKKVKKLRNKERASSSLKDDQDNNGDDEYGDDETEYDDDESSEESDDEDAITERNRN